MSSKKHTDGNGTRKSLFSGVSVVAAAAAAALTGAPAHAQDDEAIIVTGSRIPQPNLVTTSPVTQVTGEDIQTQGATRVEDVINELPQVFAAQGANISNGASGTATVDLRGLGSQRTLVLINGRRMGYGSLDSSAADLNQIPGALVERVEVLTGGASAVYGSDAVSGVVNFIMRDDFEGIRIDAQYGFYQHTNDSDDGYIREVIAARQATNPAEFQLPDDDYIGGYGKEITALIGASTADGRGNVTAYLGYRVDDAVLQRDYDYSACALAADSTTAVPGVPAGERHWNCGGSGTTAPARILSLVNFVDVTPRGPGDSFVTYNAGLHAYNYGPINYYQRPSERYTLGAFGRYEVNESVEAYTQLMFSHNSSVAQIAPSGNFLQAQNINCGDPNLGPVRAGQLGCTGPQIASDTTIPVIIGRRNVEGGGRQDDINFESYRGVIGIRGPLTDNWDYDLSAQYGSVRYNQVYRNDFSVQRLSRALDVVDADPGPGVDPQCRSFVDGTDPNCVPWNIWNTGGVTQAALDYLQVPGVRQGEATQQVVLGTVAGDLGFGSPAAESTIQAAFGFEYRRDEIVSDADNAFTTGDLAGQGGPTFGLQGSTDVFDLFAEARVPLIEGAAFADLLSVDLAYRYSDYASGATTDTYKIGAEWAPVEDIRFRGSFQRAVRAGNIIELFSSQGLGLFDMAVDPCDDASDGNTANNNIPAQCIGANPWQVSVGQSDSGLLDNPAGQYNGFFGGNPNVQPEESDTVTYGFVFSPSFLPGFNLSVDYFDIEVLGLIAPVDPTVTIADCYTNNNLTACARITRDSLGTLYIQPTAQVSALNTNIGGLQTSGYDINANYRLDIGAMGGLAFNLVGTLLDELVTDPGSGSAPYDCVGLYSGACGTPNPEWRHRFRVTWETPWNVDLSGTWRYFGSVDSTVISTVALDRTFDEQNYFDIAGSWDVLENTNIRFGVNNVFDTDPPISDNVGAGSGNGNTYPQVYDALGRWVFIGATVDF